MDSLYRATRLTFSAQKQQNRESASRFDSMLDVLLKLAVDDFDRLPEGVNPCDPNSFAAVYLSQVLFQI